MLCRSLYVNYSTNNLIRYTFRVFYEFRKFIYFFFIFINDYNCFTLYILNSYCMANEMSLEIIGNSLLV